MPDDGLQRVRNACEACHERKIKCKTSTSGGPCQSCAANGRSCFFLPRIKAGRPRRKRSPPASQPDTSSSHASPAESSAVEEYLSLEEGAFDASKTLDSTLTPPFNWAQLGGLSTGGFNTVIDANYQDMNPFDQMFDASTDPDTDMDFSRSLRNFPVPALSPDGSRGSASSMNSDASRLAHTSNMSAQDMTQPRYFSGMPQSASDESDFFKNEPLSTIQVPSFQDLLVKSSEVERLLDSLQYASFIGLNLDTSSPASSLHKMLHAVDSAGDLVLNVATHIGKGQPRQPLSCATPTSIHSNFSDAQSSACCDSINPAMLTMSPTLPDASTTSTSQDLALRALTLALSLRILDVCEVLSTVQPSNPQSHHHVLFLKRLDVNLIRVRGALQHMECSKSLSREVLTQRAMHRTFDMQGKLKVAMGQGVW